MILSTQPLQTSENLIGMYSIHYYFLLFELNLSSCSVLLLSFSLTLLKLSLSSVMCVEYEVV